MPDEPSLEEWSDEELREADQRWTYRFEQLEAAGADDEGVDWPGKRRIDKLILEALAAIRAELDAIRAELARRAE